MIDDNQQNYVLYTQGVGPSSRVYKDVRRCENGRIRLVGFDRDTWIVPAEEVKMIEEVDSSEFPPNPELHDSSGRPVDRPERRVAVLQREHYRCQSCWIDLDVDRKRFAHVHHIHPQKHGGSERLSNLAALCYKCHNAAHRNTY